MTYASIRRAYAEQLDEQQEAGSIPGKDIPLGNAGVAKRKKKKKVEEAFRDFDRNDSLRLAHELKDGSNHRSWFAVHALALEIARTLPNAPDNVTIKQYLIHALDAMDHEEKGRCHTYTLAVIRELAKTPASGLASMSGEAPRGQPPMGESAELSEASNLTGKNLVSYLTNICLDSWYGLVRKFSGNPDTYDVHQSEPHPQFNTFKMTPGNDKRDDAYESILSAAAGLTKALNGAFGKNVFEQRVSRTGGGLQVLVAFSAGKGGVFQCKAENNGGDSAINITMPNEKELLRAFSAMTDTPHPGDELGQMEDSEIPEEQVAGDIPAPNAGGEGETVPTPEIPQPAEVQPASQDPKFESMKRFLGQNLREQTSFTVSWMDAEGVMQSHTVAAQNASAAKMKTMQERRPEIPQNASFDTKEVVEDPNAARTPAARPPVQKSKVF